MKYIVNLFTQVRVKVSGVVADSMAQAMGKADSAVQSLLMQDNSGNVLCLLPDGSRVEYVDRARDPTECALVDPLLANGDVDYSRSAWLDRSGAPLAEWLTSDIRKARDADSARLFMQELLESEETLISIAEKHGARTLADLMYLQQAILSGGFVDHYPGASNAMEIAQSLPSGELWVKFIKVEYMARAA